MFSKDISADSKVWVYQSNREFLANEALLINADLKEFLAYWTAHNKDLKAYGELVYNRFLVIAVDESLNQATGCSIDKSVGFVKELETKFKTNFFVRTDIAFRDKEGDIVIKEMSNFMTSAEMGEIDSETIVFNNLISSFGDFKNKWEIPAKDSWHSQWIPVVK
ncbi:MAG: hypothetical protein ACJATA_000582 [Sphingobacteriales bacterium]|jgi:hypothetical protein